MRFVDIFSIVLLIFISGKTHSCPFYQLSPSRTNYTNITQAIYAAQINMYPIRVCNGASILANEVLPVIDFPLAIYNDLALGDAMALLYVMNTNLPPIFKISTNSFQMKNLQIESEATVLYLFDNGFMNLQNLQFLFGNVCIRMNGTSLSGVIGDHLSFRIAQVGVYSNGLGTFVCDDCNFIDSQVAGIVSSVPSFTNFQFSHLLSVNNDIMFGYQQIPNGLIQLAVITPLTANKWDFISTTTYNRKLNRTQLREIRKQTQNANLAQIGYNDYFDLVVKTNNNDHDKDHDLWMSIPQTIFLSLCVVLAIILLFYAYEASARNQKTTRLSTQVTEYNVRNY